MNRKLLDKDVQQYIRKNRESSPSKIALGKSPFSDISASELANQIDGWQRSVSKLPTWAFSDGIYYPQKINIEQCSSEHTALVKQTLIHKNARVIDLTGGFGVDSYYMAQEASEVIHCELDTDLSQIVAYNAKTLRVNNLTSVASDGIKYLEQLPKKSIDYIYIDPSRRVNHNKVFLLQDCEPNILALQDLFFAKSKYVITKLSPMLDISHILTYLPYVKMVYVVSLDNDCKELVVVQEKYHDGDPLIRAVRLFRDQLQDLTFTLTEEKATLVRYQLPENFLYEPDVSVIKAGAFKTVGKHYKVNKLHQHTHLYTSDTLVSDFPGRIFKITGVYPFNVLKKENRWDKANITTRNFPLKVDAIRKRFKIKDGGDTYLFFTTNLQEELIVVACERVAFQL